MLRLENAWAKMQARRPKFQKTGESEDVLGQWFFYEQKGWPIKKYFVVIYLKYQILLSFSNVLYITAHKGGEQQQTF